MNNDEIEAMRAEAEAKSVGPVSSSVLLAIGEGRPADVFFGVQWSGALDRLLAFLQERGEEGTISATEWRGSLEHGKAYLWLEIQWPEPDIEITLYFEVEKWFTELELVRDGQMLSLVKDGLKGPEKLETAIAVSAEDDLLHTVLAAVARIRQETT